MIDAGLTFAALVLPSGARSYELAGLRCIAVSRRDERIVKWGGWRTLNRERPVFCKKWGRVALEQLARSNSLDILSDCSSTTPRLLSALSANQRQ